MDNNNQNQNQNPKRFNVFDDGVGFFCHPVSRELAEKVFNKLSASGECYKVELVEQDQDGEYTTIRRA